MTEHTIVSDSTPLIAFIKKNELDLLKTLFTEVLIPQGVYDEISKDTPKHTREKEVLVKEIENGWLKIRNVKSSKLSKLNLGKGEVEAINLCFEIKAPLLLIDEKKGRNIAESYKIDVIGTLGVLALANKRNLKNKQEINENLSLLIKKNFYFSSDIILHFLNKLK